MQLMLQERIGAANFIINDMNNSGYGGMYVNAPKPFYGYAVDGTEKAKTYYEESNGVKYLKWNIAGDKDEIRWFGIRLFW